MIEGTNTGWQAKIKLKAEELKKELFALYLATKHPRTPWYVKLWLFVIIGYAISPIDLIPDFIPVLGLLDDIILLPLGIWLALKMIPADVMAECRANAENRRISSRAKWIGSAVIVLLWMLLLFWLFRFVFYNFIDVRDGGM